MVREQRPAVDSSTAVWEAVRVARRYRLRGGLFFVGVMLTVVVGMAVCKRVYISDALLFIRIGRESVALDPTATTGQIMSLNESREAEIRSAQELLLSRGLCEQVVDALGPDFILDPPAEGGSAAGGSRGDGPLAYLWEQAFAGLRRIGLSDPAGKRELAVTELRSSLTAEIPDKANVIGVACQGRSPRHAQQLLERIVDCYLAEHLQAHRTEGSYEFFEEQRELLAGQLLAASESLRNAKNDFGMTSISGRRELLEQQQRTNETRIFQVKNDLAAARNQVAGLRETIERLPEKIVLEQNEGLANTAADNMRERLYDLQIQERQLLATRTADHPSVVFIRDQVKEMTDILSKEREPRGNWTTGIHPTRQPLELEMLRQESLAGALEAQLASLKEQRAELAEQSGRLNEQEIKIAELQREVDLLEVNVRANADRFEQARVDQVLKLERISNVSVVQAPSLIEKPVSPKKLLCLVLGLLFASCGSAAVIYLSHQWELSQGGGSLAETEAASAGPAARRPGNGRSELSLTQT